MKKMYISLLSYEGSFLDYIVKLRCNTVALSTLQVNSGS